MKRITFNESISKKGKKKKGDFFLDSFVKIILGRGVNQICWKYHAIELMIYDALLLVFLQFR